MKIKRPIKLVVALFLIAFLFKVLHLQGANILLLVSLLSLLLVGIYNFSKKTNRTALDYSKLILILALVVENQLIMFELPAGALAQIFLLLATIVWLVLEETNPIGKGKLLGISEVWFSRLTIALIVVSFALNRTQMAGAQYCYFLSLLMLFVFVIVFRKSYLGLGPAQ